MCFRMEGHNVIKNVIFKGRIGHQPLPFSILHDASSFFLLHAPCKSSLVKPVMDSAGINCEPKVISFLHWFIVSVCFVVVCFKFEIDKYIPLGCLISREEGIQNIT